MRSDINPKAESDPASSSLIRMDALGATEPLASPSALQESLGWKICAGRPVYSDSGCK
ncbi:MAG: hypothetical protein U0V48_12245 [Anaerolineales bacterium]